MADKSCDHILRSSLEIVVMNITIHFLIKRKGPSQIIDCFGNIVDTGIHFVASHADLSWALSRASAWEAMHLFDQIICIFILMFSNLEKHGSWSKCLSFTLFSFASVESKTPQKQIFADHAKRVNLTQEWSVPISFFAHSISSSVSTVKAPKTRVATFDGD